MTRKTKYTDTKSKNSLGIKVKSEKQMYLGSI